MGLKIFRTSVAHTTTATTTTSLGRFMGRIEMLQLLSTTTCTVSIHASTSTSSLLNNVYLLGSSTARTTCTTSGLTYYPVIAGTITGQGTPAAGTNWYEKYVVNYDDELKLAVVGNLDVAGTYTNTVEVVFYYDDMRD